MISIMYLLYAFFATNNNFIEDNNTSGDVIQYTAIFEKNGADLIEKTEITCNVINDKCEITLPNILKSNGVVLGWNNENVHYAKYQEGAKIELTSNQLFYAITYHENKLTIYDNDLDYISENEVSCRVYNSDKSCSVVIPNYNKIGYESRGYSLRKDSLTGVIFPNQNYNLKKDIVLYPIYNTLTRGEKINVSKVIKKYDFTIEVENGCSSDVYNGYMQYIDKIHNNAKYLLIGSKITILSSKTFDRMWGSNYVGMNYGPNYLRLFDVKCPQFLDKNYYPTIVHELAHTWDFYYRNYFSKNISDENDFINLYTKYQNMSDRPFRDYSYSNIREFFADSVRYYYFKYIDPMYEYYILKYPLDIKETIEKYICIANNGYNNTTC